MDKGTLYVMCGTPGSGKTTFVKNNFKGVHISRDEIRFSLVKEDEEYFSKEKEVFAKFVAEINKNLAAGFDVCADATHLNSASRAKLFRAVTAATIKIVYIRAPLNICFERNENRKGTRAYVPREQIKRMYKSFEIPSYEEDERIVAIYSIDTFETPQYEGEKKVKILTH